MKTLLILCCLLGMSQLSAQTEDKKNVVYKYKKYEKFDLGDFSIEGTIITPGDLTVESRERKRFSTDLYDREDFDKETKKELNNIR